ncbi:hypothetical protein HN873_008045, partial [Arachis hypogaea]
AVLARVTTEKRMSMIKAREESEKSRAENKRRESTYVEDLFIVHIVGMDTMACGFKNAAKLIEDGSLAQLVKKRYQIFDNLQPVIKGF